MLSYLSPHTGPLIKLPLGSNAFYDVCYMVPMLDSNMTEAVFQIDGDN
jgi:hypothetical protein